MQDLSSCQSQRRQRSRTDERHRLHQAGMCAVQRHVQGAGQAGHRLRHGGHQPGRRGPRLRDGAGISAGSRRGCRQRALVGLPSRPDQSARRCRAERVAGNGTVGQEEIAVPACSLVYFSSVSENTHRFVQKLGIPATRIPLHGRIEVDEPYVLVLPTYGGGRATPDIKDGGYVPKQVIAFLNNEHNRSLIRGVIAAGNNNFGAEFAYAGDVVSRKCDVPYLYRLELMGTPDDVEAVRAGLADFWKEQTSQQPSLQSL